MPKEIRFSKLVQTSGKPETVALWTKPKDNPDFMKAVEENRVITVFQKPNGGKKDFGAFGFHQEKFASYLVFPKKLPKLEDTQIIGIKYELLKEQSPRPPVKKKVELPKVERLSTRPGSPPARNGIHKFKPDQVTKEFEVKILRTGTVETILTVNAKTISEAEAKA